MLTCGGTYQHVYNYNGHMKVCTLGLESKSETLKTRNCWLYINCNDGEQAYSAITTYNTSSSEQFITIVDINITHYHSNSIADSIISKPVYILMPEPKKKESRILCITIQLKIQGSYYILRTRMNLLCSCCNTLAISIEHFHI